MRMGFMFVKRLLKKWKGNGWGWQAGAGRVFWAGLATTCHHKHFQHRERERDRRRETERDEDLTVPP